MKIAVYAISKNEEQFVQRFCDSAQDADLILIADTGSTDKTVEHRPGYFPRRLLQVALLSPVQQHVLGALTSRAARGVMRM